ncbi:hypothetical protein NE237_006825 [Protea cynaroides]|uniref:Uncharacterized protein n=1 Tax=Protea cynaroides TaxID=273540 RepID=A0A9Q0KNU0_9MAGN|nr:hypothetical protein NE237_006825 [Protea cynaroides]
MRNLYPKNKVKVYPSPSSSSSSTIPYCSSPTRDALSVLKLLPVAILALISVLSLEDREVLAYMITRSLTTTTSPSSMIEEKNKCKKLNAHKLPLFDCGCFDCYRSYWFRWDSSPNRELIHHAIEAFEEHLNNGELSKKNNGRGKKKDRMSRRRVIEKLATDRLEKERVVVSDKEAETPEKADSLPRSDAYPIIVSCAAEEEVEEEENQVEEEEKEEEDDVKCTPGMEAEVQVPAARYHHKGLVRKVLPDVLGLFNSRLWNLWGPSV